MRDFKKNIIYDCDCTLGIKDCDVDDGLALLYLLSREDVNLIGITSTYGNSDLETVNKSLHKLISDIDRPDIPIICGGDKPKAFNSEASNFIIEQSFKYKNNIHIVGTGSTTNIGGAFIQDHTLANRISSVTLIGGITSPLQFNKSVMDELNLSGDAYATIKIMKYAKNLSIVTGNNCLPTLVATCEFRALLAHAATQKSINSNFNLCDYILKETDYYFEYNQHVYGFGGFILWDVVAVAFLLEPALFQSNISDILISEKNLSTGFLETATESSENNNDVASINMPTVLNPKALANHIISTWEAF